VAARVVVLVSGTGTLLQALLDASGDDFDIVAVISDQPDAFALERAQGAGVATAVLAPSSCASRDDWNLGFANLVGSHNPDLIVCAGFMRVLGPEFLSEFPDRIINSHPALLPSFPGAHGVRDALAYGVHVTGCTVHVVDGGVDTGPILAQRVVEVLQGDDESSLHERIKVEERLLLVNIVHRLSVGGIRITGRRVTFQ